MEHNINQIMALNLEMSDASIVHAPLPNMQSVKTQEHVPQGEKKLKHCAIYSGITTIYESN